MRTLGAIAGALLLTGCVSVDADVVATDPICGKGLERRTTAEFYSDASIGEFWIGPRPALPGVAADLGVATAHIDDFASREGELVVDEDEDLTRFVSELRLVKDEYEVAQMKLAVEVTARGFDDIVANIPAIVAHPRGERIVEGVFHQRARSDGNAVGYDTIAAAGGSGGPPAQSRPPRRPPDRRNKGFTHDDTLDFARRGGGPYSAAHARLRR